MAAHESPQSKSLLLWLSGLVVVAIAIALISAASAPEPVSIRTDPPDYAAIDRYVQAQMKDGLIPGFALGIIRGDQILYLRGYGVADPSGRPVTPQTPFLIASVSKTFTALAVMQLVEAGKIDLDRPVSDHLTNLPPPHGVYQQMTVRQLLNHTAGFQTEQEYRVVAPGEDDVSLAELTRRFSSVRLAHAPGAAFTYNNPGFCVLGELISQVSGLSYEEYLQRHIFDPLEMHHSYASMDRAREDGAAVGYRTLFGFPCVSGLTYAPGFAPAFGILSSAEDLTHYMIAMLNGGIYNGTRILSPEGVAEMLTPSASESPYVHYGLGWFVTSGSYYHGGELTDYQAKVKLLPEDQLGVAFVLNSSSSTASLLFDVGYRERIETGIINILYGASPTDQPGLTLLTRARHPMAITRSLMIALTILVITFLVGSALRLRTLPTRLEDSRGSFWTQAIIMLLLNLLLPLWLLLAVRQQSASWGHLLHYIPDVGWLALTLAIALLVIGVAKAAIVARLVGAHRYPEY